MKSLRKKCLGLVLVSAGLFGGDYYSAESFMHPNTTKVRHVSYIRGVCMALDAAQQEEVISALYEASSTYNVSFEFLLAMINIESRCQPKARSSRGAMGLMQLMPATAKHLGVNDAYDIRENIMGGARYLSLLLKDFRGNVRMALAAYNAGPTAVRKYKNVPPFKETKLYVTGVLRIYESFARAV